MSNQEPSSEADFDIAKRAVERGWLTEEEVESAILLREEDTGRSLLSFLPLSPDQVRELGAPAFRAVPPEAKAAMSVAENRVGRYWIESHIGSGGMARVHRAWDGELHRWVALKFLKQIEDGKAREYFLREAQLAASLDHPNIAKIFEVGERDGAPFIAMQYVDGKTLREAAPELDFPEKLRVVARVADAVAHAHRKLVIHRDLKPGNVMVDREGRVYVMDFGLAKIREVDDQDEPLMSLGGSRVLVGTPNYMPPEQARGEADQQSDVYGIGAILYEMATGRPPFEGETTADILLKVTQKDPVRPRNLVPKIAADVEAVVLKCLEKERERRYGRVVDLIEDLARLERCEPLKYARRITFRYLLAKKVRRQPLLCGLVGGLVLLGLLAFGLGARLWYDRTVRVSRERIRTEASAAYEEGGKFLKEGLARGAAPALEQAIVLLTEAADKFRDLPDERFREVSSVTGVAMAREKLAYFGSRTGRIYSAEGMEIVWRPTLTGDDISPHPIELKEGEIRSTDIADAGMWREARIQYRRVADLLVSEGSEATDSTEVKWLLSSARSSGYFLICDHLRTGEDSLPLARRVLAFVADLAGPERANLQSRYRDALAKLHFIDVLSRATPRPVLEADQRGLELMEITEELVSYNDALAKRDPARISLIVLHCTELPTLDTAREYAERILYERSGTGNCGHYYVDRDGRVHRYVSDDRVANHVLGHNPESIGIEIVNRGRYPDWYSSENQVPEEEYPDAQIDSLIRLLVYLKARRPDITKLMRHSDLDTSLIPAEDDPRKKIRRKIDPGPLFPWGRVSKEWVRLND